MAKINFTPEHMARLKELAIEMLFRGFIFKGTVGTSLTVYDLIHNTSETTLIIFNGNLKKEIERVQTLDEWSMNDYQQKKLADTKETQEFINLLIGYKKNQAQLNADKAKLAELRAQYKEIEKSTLTPQDQLAAIKKQMKELGADDIEDIPVVEETSKV